MSCNHLSRCRWADQEHRRESKKHLVRLGIREGLRAFPCGGGGPYGFRCRDGRIQPRDGDAIGEVLDEWLKDVRPVNAAFRTNLIDKRLEVAISPIALR